MMLRSLSAIAALLILLAACGGDDDGPPDVGCERGSVQVVVTLPMFADFVCTVGGELVTVQALIPPDASPGDYEPLPEQAPPIRGARLVLHAGLDLDAPTREFIFQHGRGSAQILAYTRSIASPTVDQPAGEIPTTAEEAGDNPYLWLDPEIAEVYVDATRDSLEIVHPDGIQMFRANTDAYIREIEELATEMESELASIAEEDRKLYTRRDTASHFARRFGFEVAGFLLDSAGDADAEAAAVVAQAGVRAIFAERGYESSAMQALADETGVELCFLYTDKVDGDAHTYLEMMRANAEEISDCLGDA